ncbi:hypothetical protein BPNPMPFG_002527 [Mesorhizobium sp. AR07]|uniref:hypothetical protein n=1 Tax=Mesorhizobium sp. AR07 TaxID=2865838 RepID=UPI00215E5620|nr:hypothetical protein [Mesorhizobium sp. AR07]UVK46817.1 hypothetical protein BPNPMPFG_002527 [Mesorhizobium sp. AR07]
MSLLLDHGHPNALRYPVSMVFAEAGYVVKRINAQMAAQTSLLQMALSTIPNESVKPAATQKAAKELMKHLKGMIDGE